MLVSYPLCFLFQPAINCSFTFKLKSEIQHFIISYYYIYTQFIYHYNQPTPFYVLEFKTPTSHFCNNKQNREKSTQIPTYFEIYKRWIAEMKAKKVLGIKKKIKKKIYIIFINEEYLGSPQNTNSFLLKKHQPLETNNGEEVQPPGSMLSYLLNEKKIDHQSNNPNNFESIKDTIELPQLPNNYYQI
ncbi:unnamed protein product (macronuclear) [Paramecium tetraurelia]|uniref:Uncharacterized protein n=1 Tax=Paramecium tetraurelia TaxID=5888 RepID=A0DP74_PARTE|nr:uncharacterized protein GSPATT00019023001 [Paramecium tetraurelia]CAK84841.1 unnamed protein product [Paramecium tetraurelia]|eukprot:XP_001452238.1 hypothetical protein (macronuclear) [Paramecium tetraurelia strain d4-2]